MIPVASYCIQISYHFFISHSLITYTLCLLVHRFELNDCDCLIHLVVLLSTLLHRSQMLPLYVHLPHTITSSHMRKTKLHNSKLPNYNYETWPRQYTYPVIKEKLFVFTDDYRKKIIRIFCNNYNNNLLQSTPIICSIHCMKIFPTVNW